MEEEQVFLDCPYFLIEIWRKKWETDGVERKQNIKSMETTTILATLSILSFLITILLPFMIIKYSFYLLCFLLFFLFSLSGARVYFTDYQNWLFYDFIEYSFVDRITTIYLLSWPLFFHLFRKMFFSFKQDNFMICQLKI